MKKILSLLVLCAVCISLFSCNTNTATEDPAEVSDTTSYSTTNTDLPEAEPSNNDQITTTTYLSADVRKKVEEYLENSPKVFSIVGSYYSPYASQDVFGLSGIKLNSVSIPVHSVGKADEQGDYTFTLFVVGNSYADLKKAPLRTYELKLNGEKYGFTDKAKIGKFVDVDLKEYGISIAENETLAWYAADDTVYPAGVPAQDSEVRRYLTDKFAYGLGYFGRVGTSELAMYPGALIMDFEYECEEDTRAAEYKEYEEMVAALKDKYSGKYVSVVGDSISTFGGYSNNTANNSTTGNNEVYYKTDLMYLVSWENTYWGRLIKDLDMNLCVNNSRSGSAVFGRSVNDYTDSSLYRAQELDNDAGTPDDPTDDIKPDVILYYMGINAQGESQFGDLYKLLENADAANYNAIIDEWFGMVLNNTSNGTNTIPVQTVGSFEQAYALTVYKMKQAYPDAEIFCINLVRNESKTDEDIRKYNFCIEAIAEYLGATLVDQNANSGITPATYHAYMGDERCLHPNAAGHYLMTRTILETLLEKHK